MLRLRVERRARRGGFIPDHCCRRLPSWVSAVLATAIVLAIVPPAQAATHSCTVPGAGGGGFYGLKATNVTCAQAIRVLDRCHSCDHAVSAGGRRYSCKTVPVGQYYAKKTTCRAAGGRTVTYRIGE